MFVMIFQATGKHGHQCVFCKFSILGPTFTTIMYLGKWLICLRDTRLWQQLAPIIEKHDSPGEMEPAGQTNRKKKDFEVQCA